VAAEFTEICNSLKENRGDNNYWACWIYLRFLLPISQGTFALTFAIGSQGSGFKSSTSWHRLESSLAKELLLRGILGLQPLLCQPRLGQQGSDQLLTPSSSGPSNAGVGLGAFSTGGDRGSPYSCTSGHTTHTRRLGGHSVSCCREHLTVFRRSPVLCI